MDEHSKRTQASHSCTGSPLSN